MLIPHYAFSHTRLHDHPGTHEMKLHGSNFLQQKPEMFHIHQPVPSLEHAASKYLKYKNLDLLCWLIFCQRRHNRKSVWHNEWMTRTAQEAAGSHFKGRPAVCCSLRSSREQLVCCHYVTDTHQRSYCSADKVKAIHIPSDLSTFPSFLHPEPQITACAGNEVKLGSKKHAPLQRGTGHKFTVVHGLECKPLFFIGPN